MKKLITSIFLFFSFSTFTYAYNEGFHYNNGLFIYVGTEPTSQYHHSRTKCKFIPAHWYRGNWYPAREVCYKKSYRNNVRCGWVPGYWQHGRWYPRHQICW